MPMTDASNFGTKFGRRKPCLRYIGPLLHTASVAPVGRGDHTPPGGAGEARRAFHPPFSFWRTKKKMAVEPSKEKTLVAAQLRARDAPCRAAGCGAKPFCSLEVIPT